MRILKLVGNAGRAQVLHVLAASSTPLSTTEVSQAAGIQYRSALLNLQALEAEQLVRANMGPEEDRHGHQLEWTADRTRIRVLLAELTRYLLGEG